jgi:hypothetical protein
MQVLKNEIESKSPLILKIIKSQQVEVKALYLESLGCYF